MSTAVPLTAGTEIARSFAASTVSSAEPATPDLPRSDPFASDTLTLSRLARERQQNETLVNDSAGAEVPESGDESVSVSSSTGQSSSRGGLAQQEAIALYQRVASLL
ncbi:hypothetical protein HBA55_12730 [Pseudomaricurvus alkylphenolicus]|uniref:hypothetical protein n=1 Tax=Pseudomaricurvus alkylphenolicus TaxID=1306991 RepID=UPI001420349A|nr:hypothetical protein [Pseudomaricurvus alkylphenolicus]NIB40458.1 hypothetical protein [Pseudomaricurvus alkylphenolicus]